MPRALCGYSDVYSVSPFVWLLHLSLDSLTPNGEIAIGGVELYGGSAEALGIRGTTRCGLWLKEIGGYALLVQPGAWSPFYRSSWSEFDSDLSVSSRGR